MKERQRRVEGANARHRAKMAEKRACRRASRSDYRQDRVWFSEVSPIPDDIKGDIYRVVRAVEFTNADGGTCVWRNGVGHLVLSLLGFEPELRVGGCLYRAGPHEVRDTLGFCGPGNTGQMINGCFVGHAWLGLGDEVIDFSCGEWRSFPMQAEIDNGMEVYGPIRWVCQPPAMIWCDRGALPRWQPYGSPELGEVWYGPWQGEPNSALNAMLKEHVESLAEGIAVNLVLAGLDARVKALH